MILAAYSLVVLVYGFNANPPTPLTIPMETKTVCDTSRTYMTKALDERHVQYLAYCIPVQEKYIEKSK